MTIAGERIAPHELPGGGALSMTRHQAQTTERYGSRYALSDAGSSTRMPGVRITLDGLARPVLFRRVQATGLPPAASGAQHPTSQHSAKIFSADES